MRREEAGLMETYAVCKLALGAPVHGVLRTRGVPGHGCDAVLAAVEVRRCKHGVLEALVARVARAGRCRGCGLRDDDGGNGCEGCAGEEQEHGARWKEMHREEDDVYSLSYTYTVYL